MGVVDYKRTIYEVKENEQKKFVCLLDEALNLTEFGKISSNLVEKVLNLAVETNSYRDAAEELMQNLNISMSHETVRDIVIKAGLKVNEKELEDAIIEASKYDKKVLIEEGIDGREVECAVLGNEDVISSSVGEIRAADEFYSYDAKYKNQESKTLIPADILDEKPNEIRMLAVKAFKAIDGKGLSRVDFFIENGSGKVLSLIHI